MQMIKLRHKKTMKETKEKDFTQWDEKDFNYDFINAHTNSVRINREIVQNSYSKD